MKTKPAPKFNRVEPFRNLNSSSLLIKKKKPKELKAKKTVHFNLSVRSSSSEEMFSHMRVVGEEPAFKSDLEQELSMRSKSTTDFAGHTKLRWHDLRTSVTCMFVPSPFPSQLPFPLCQLKCQKKVVGTFNKHFWLGPILNLKWKMPRKGILKNVPCTGSTNEYDNSKSKNESKSPAQVLSWPSPDMSESDSSSDSHCNSAEFHHALVWPPAVAVLTAFPYHTSQKVQSQTWILDDLTASIQSLSISALPEGDVACAKVSMTADSRFNCERNVPSVYNCSHLIDQSQTHSSDAGFGVTQEGSLQCNGHYYNFNNNGSEKACSLIKRESEQQYNKSSPMCGNQDRLQNTELRYHHHLTNDVKTDPGVLCLSSDSIDEPMGWVSWQEFPQLTSQQCVCERSYETSLLVSPEFFHDLEKNSCAPKFEKSEEKQHCRGDKAGIK